MERSTAEPMGGADMLLIWGWRVRRKTLSSGTFFSPAAGRDAPYHLIEARRWFTLFFIPLIPLKRLGTFVECQETKTTYNETILEGPTNAALTEQLAAVARAVVAAVAAAGGPVSAQRRRVAIEVLGSYVEGYDKTDLRADVAKVAESTIDDDVAGLSRALNEHGKERLLSGAASVLVADGTVEGPGREVVNRVGRQLGMSTAHVHGVVDLAMSALNT